MLASANVACGDASILDHGAVGDGVTLNTAPIQAAIDEVAQTGGVLTVPEGVFLTGAIFLKQGVELRLDEGAVLLGSTSVADYPKRMTRIEGHFEEWLPALLNGEGLTGVRITGAGVLDGNGSPFWKAFWKRRAENPQCTNLEVERPRLVHLADCSEVTLEGVHLKDSGFWNLHLYRCRDVVLEGLSITAPHGAPPRITGSDRPWDEVAVERAPSSDGIDVDSCQRVTIRDCVISVGDDCVALKGTKGPDALEDASSPPVEDILITGCDFVQGHGMLVCGSEATIVRNVTVRDCVVRGGNPLVRLKLRPDTPQRYENIVVENVRVDGAQALFDVKPWTQFLDLRGRAPSPSVVVDLRVRGLRGSLQSLGDLWCNPSDSIVGVSLEDIDVRVSHTRFRLNAAEGIALRDVRVNGEDYTLPKPRGDKPTTREAGAATRESTSVSADTPDHR